MDVVYCLVLDSGSWDSYQTYNIGAFLSKDKCMEYLWEIHNAAQSIQKQILTERPSSKLTVFELGVGAVGTQFRDQGAYSGKDLHKLMTELVGKFEALAPQDSDYWDVSGGITLRVVEIPLL